MGNSVKQNIRLSILTVLLVLSVILVSIGFAYSRFQSNTGKDIEISVKKPVEFYITGLERANDGGLTQTAAPVLSEQTDGTYKMLFRIDNGTASDDEAYTLSIIASLGLTPDCEMELITTTPNGMERSYTAVVQEIAEDSEFYSQFGPGYEYSFYDNDGNEVIWQLAGGRYSYNDYTLKVDGIAEASLIEIIAEESK